MNTLFFCWEYPPLGAGVGRYVAEMAAALNAAGHKVTVATSMVDGMPGRIEENGVEILRCFRHEDAADAATCDLIMRLARERRMISLRRLSSSGLRRACCPERDVLRLL
jgi:hypothetical protein